MRRVLAKHAGERQVAEAGAGGLESLATGEDGSWVEHRGDP